MNVDKRAIQSTTYHYCKVQTKCLLDYMDDVRDNPDSFELVKARIRMVFMQQQTTILNMIWSAINTGTVLQPFDILKSEEYHDRQEKIDNG